MSKTESPSDSSQSANARSRREFLALSAIATAAVGLAVSNSLIGSALAADAPADSTFTVLARFLTGRLDLDERIVARAYEEFTAYDPSFAGRAVALARAIKVAGLADVDALVSSPLYADDRHRSTAIAIVSAFYLGRVGTGTAARLVSFEKALMFRPTADMVPIPTYAIGGPGWWGKAAVLPQT